MAGTLNKVILIGNVGKDPEIRSTADGKEIASFPLATSDVWKDKMTQERRERTEWHRVVVFNDALVNSVIKNYVKKGTKLYIEGSLQTRKWTDNAGQDRYSTEVILQNYSSNITLLDSRNSADGRDNSYDNSSSNEKSEKNFAHSELDDEIPF